MTIEQREVDRKMQPNTSDFINLPAFARAVADHLKDSLVNRTGARRVLNLVEAAEYCGLTRDSFKKKWSGTHYAKSASINAGASTSPTWTNGSTRIKKQIAEETAV